MTKNVCYTVGFKGSFLGVDSLGELATGSEHEIGVRSGGGIEVARCEFRREW